MKALALFPVALIALAGCSDPVHDDLLDKLGPEKDGVEAGPLHRPGQPCLACHDGTGPAARVFSVAGTVYQTETEKKPLVAAIVLLTDAEGRKHKAETNCAGNFFVQKVDWEPTYPMIPTLTYGSFVTGMTTHIGREGSCAGCHTGTIGPRTESHVYLSSDPIELPPSGCK